MVNKTVGSGTAGNILLKLGGNTTVTTAVSGLGSGWQEIKIPFDKTCWLEEFGQDSFDIASCNIGAGSRVSDTYRAQLPLPSQILPNR